MYLIKEMPLSERPREKLLNHGVEKLSNVELLAILLRTGNKNKSVIDLSKDVLYKIEQISDLKNVSINELLKIPGIKMAKAATIIAAIELGKRLEQKINKDLLITTSEDVYYLMKHLVYEEQEHLYCLYLNAKLGLIKKSLIFIGTVDEVLLHPREIFKDAVKSSASYIILVHNHPTGNANASIADINSTKELMKISKMMDIEIIDHIIIGNREFYSYKEDRVFII